MGGPWRGQGQGGLARALPSHGHLSSHHPVSQGKYGSVIVESLGGWQGLQRLLGTLKPIAQKASEHGASRTPRPPHCALAACVACASQHVPSQKAAPSSLPAPALPSPQHGTTIANVSARWVLQQPQVPAVILGARNATHVPDHRALFAFELDASDMDAIEGFLAGTRPPTGDCYDWERGGTF